jgi:hypothetical protein
MTIPKPSRKDRLEAERLERESSTLRRGQLRHEVIVRAAGACEWCGDPVPPGELHHVLGGSGRRRQEERLDTLAFLCLACHKEVHAGRAAVLENAVAWTYRHGFMEAREALDARLSKIQSAKWDFFKGTP